MTEDRLSANPRVASRWSRRTVIWTLILAAWFLLPLGWIVLGATHVGGFSDSINYLLVAEFFRDTFSGHLSPVVAERFASTRFPPLFPLLLAATGAGADNQVAAFWVSGIAAALAVFAIWLWLRRELADVLAASWTALAFTALPGLYLLIIYPVSETLFMALAYLALALAPSPKHRPIGALAFALLISIVPLARSIGIALVAAGCLSIASIPALPARKKLLACLIAVVPALAWAAYRAALPNAAQYTEVLDVAIVLRELGGWKGLLLGQPVAMFMGYVQLLDPHFGAPAKIVTSLLAGLTALGLFRALIVQRFDAWFLLAYWGVVWLWPYPHEISRLLLPTMPIVLLHSITGAVAVGTRTRAFRRTTNPASAAGLLLVLVLLACGPILVQFGRRVTAPVDPTLEPFKRSETYLTHRSQEYAELILAFDARLYFALRALHDVVPPQDCVYTSLPEMVRLHGRVAAVPLPPRIDPTLPIRPQLAKCRYFLIHQASTRQLGYPPLYPLKLISGWTQPVFQSWETSGREKYSAVMLLKRID